MRTAFSTADPSYPAGLASVSAHQGGVHPDTLIEGLDSGDSLVLGAKLVCNSLNNLVGASNVGRVRLPCRKRYSVARVIEPVHMIIQLGSLCFRVGVMRTHSGFQVRRANR